MLLMMKYLETLISAYVRWVMITSDSILDQIDAATGVVRGMVKELILHGGITLPCKLQDDELELICEEIRCLRPLITEEHELEIYLARPLFYYI